MNSVSLPAKDTTALVERLREFASPETQQRSFVAADMRNADLAGATLQCVSLAGARLDGANLSGATLRYVDLSAASLRGARLDGAQFECVQAGSACFAEAQAEQSHWEQTSLVAADFADTRLARSTLRGCSLESAKLHGTDLTLCSLVYSNCDGASFSGALLDRATTSDTSFRDADFGQARRFLGCREVIVEILRREIHDDVERAKRVGAIAMNRKWCYAEWKHLLEFEPYYRQLAIDIFRRYPESGFTQALNAGLSGDRLSDIALE